MLYDIKVIQGKIKEAMLTEEEILGIYKDRHWIIFEPDALRAVTIAQAQLDKILSEFPDMNERERT